MKKQTVIGTNTTVDFTGYAHGIAAKVDTGADSTSVWASNIRVDEYGELRFMLFAPSSAHYTGEELVRTDYSVARVRSSNGEVQVRFRTHFSMVIGGKKMRVLCNLSDRSRNIYPVLIGRRTLHGKFLVDVTQREHPKQPKTVNEQVMLQQEFLSDKQAFYQKYYN